MPVRPSVTWLVQRPPPADDSPTFALLLRACNELHLPLEALDLVPGQPPSLPSLDGPIIIHGRKTLLDAALRDPVYRRAVFNDTENFHPSAYLRGWGPRMLNAQQQSMTWAEALHASQKAPVFVRPDDDNKLFTGAVFSASGLRQLFEKIEQHNGIHTESPVVVAPVREIDAEARLFIVSKEVIGGSFYRPDAAPRLPSELISFAELAVEAWQPHEVFVLDVARADGAYWVIEANGFNGSRFYGADVANIVKRVSEYQANRW
jgi:hypothetical protein